MKVLPWLSLLVSLGIAGAAMMTPALAATAPDPEITVTGNNTFEVSWPDLAPGFILQESDSPADTAVWRGIAVAPTISGGRLRVTRTLDANAVRAFYRVRTKGVNPGLDYLRATQSPAGTWGDPQGSASRDSSAALDALALFSQSSSTLDSGLASLFGLANRNNDTIARKALTLAAAGYDVSSLIAELLASQSAAVADPANLSYPGLGWGLSRGFGSSALDTALVLRALRAGNALPGLAVVKEVIPASGASAAFPFQVTAGANNIFLRIRSITGGRLRFDLTQPNGATVFTTQDPRNSTLNVGPLSPLAGNWTLKVQNLSAVQASFIAEIGYTDGNGFDVFRTTTPYVYLVLAQNADGGWGVSPGEDSHLMVTSEALRALAGGGPSFRASQPMAAGAAWLRGRQNANGGFGGTAGSSTVNETSLAMLALRTADPTTSLRTAAAYLKGAQQPDGSWGGNPYLTAAAIQALHLPPTVSPIPDQSVSAPTLFAAINLDTYVTDPDHTDAEISWTVTGNQQLGVSIVGRVATITYPPNPSGPITELLTFHAVDPDGLSASVSATFSVQFVTIDYVIPRSGFVEDSRIISGAPEVMARAASITHAVTGPPWATYLRLGAGFISGTEIRVDYRITIAADAPIGTGTLRVDNQILDTSNQPIGPLSNSVFNFGIQVTP